MAKTKAQKLVEKRQDEFHAEIMEMVRSLEDHFDKLRERVVMEAKNVSLEEFEALRVEINMLSKQIERFDPDEEATEIVKGYEEQLERINAIGEEKLAQIVASAHSASEDMHSKLDTIDGIPGQVERQLDEAHSKIISRVDKDLVKTLDKIREYTNAFEKRANKLDNQMNKNLNKVNRSIRSMRSTARMVDNAGVQIAGKMFGWWFVITMFTAFVVGFLGWATASYFLG